MDERDAHHSSEATLSGQETPHQWEEPPPLLPIQRRELVQDETPLLRVHEGIPSEHSPILPANDHRADRNLEPALDATSSQTNELPPAWSPPPPSYQTVSAMVTEDRAARGMLPLSQDGLERLFERVAELRRAGGASSSEQVTQQDSLDADLEALAQRIAGINTAPRVIKR